MTKSNGSSPSVTRATLYENIKDAVPSLTEKDSAKIVDNLIHIMKESLIEGDEIKVSGFGKFVVRDKQARKGRNPQTGEDIIISARRVVTWKPSSTFRFELNGFLDFDEDRKN